MYNLFLFKNKTFAILFMNLLKDYILILNL